MLGFTMALGAAILYATNTLLTKRLPGLRPEVVAFMNTIIGVLLLFPLANFSALPETSLQWSYLLILGLVHTLSDVYFIVFSLSKAADYADRYAGVFYIPLSLY